MTRPTRLYDHDGYLGCVSRTRSRETGTLVGVYQAEQAGIEDDPATPWATVCEEHGACVCHCSLADARSHAAFPSGWCEECREARAVICPDHWHCDPRLAAHACGDPDRSLPCPTCGGEAAR